MKYFTTDTHFGHPLVTVLRGFTTFDPDRAQYTHILREQGRKAAEDWAKQIVLDDSRLNFRKAADTDAHDAAVVVNINTLVGEDDELWILGDIGYRTSVEHLKDCLRQLRCQHLHAIIGNHDDWWMGDKPALNLFESIEPNGTVKLSGFDEAEPDAAEIVNLSHFPYREDLAYSWPDDAVRFHDQSLPYDGHKLLYGHTHQLSPAGARPEALNVGLDAWNLAPVSQTQVSAWFREVQHRITGQGTDDASADSSVPKLDMPSFPEPAAETNSASNNRIPNAEGGECSWQS